MPVVMSEKMRKYFTKIENDVAVIYEYANKARKIGVDPSPEVECPPAKDMAGRVEKLVGPEGIGEILRKWKEGGAGQDELCFRAMDQILEGKFGELPKNEKVDLAIRVALAIKTEGVVSAPLEGIAKIIVRENKTGGQPYLALYFAGPIRAAGGTVQAFAVLCAEHVRRKMEIAPWKASEDEVGRMVEEVKLYDRIMNLQYPSTKEELEFAVRHLTVELNGEPTERREVSAHRDLPRIDTNFVRGGPCLVLNDGVLLKSKKILRTIDKRKIPGWDWLRQLKELAHSDNKAKIDNEEKDKAKDYGGDTYKGKKIRETHEDKDVPIVEETPVSRRIAALEAKNPPLNKFIADIIAGRPVFSFPSRIGGHRIRYGRSRNTGLAACGTHPSQMILLDEFMAIGTQIRIERPGKSGSTMPVTSIEPPIVKMKNGDVIQLWNIKDTVKITQEKLYDEILFLGDMLFGYGEFVENNHTVLPSGYVEEWWAVELEDRIQNSQKQGLNPFISLPPELTPKSIREYIQNPFDQIPSGFDAITIASQFQVGIHPRYLDHWGNINGDDLIAIRAAFGEGLRSLLKIPADQPINLSSLSFAELAQKSTDGITVPHSDKVKSALETAFILHTVSPHGIHIDSDRTLIFTEILGFGSTSTLASYNFEIPPPLLLQIHNKTALDSFPDLTTLKVPDKAPHYMGSRMGRPEKAKERKMKPPVHSLFPIGQDSKLQRSFEKATARSKIKVELCQKQCPQCQTVTFLNKCPNCGELTTLKKICRDCHRLYDISETECPECSRFLATTTIGEIPLKNYFQAAASKIPKTIPDVKGVKGMVSEYKIPEPIEKGILRAIHNVWVYKDGTIRTDATDIPLTHFTCKEIKTPVAKIRELGYDVDVYGKPVTESDQILELKVQDILLTDHIADYFVQVAKFVDDELEYLYHQPRFYNISSKEELIGHYFAGLAPHTSAAIIGRMIGITRAESGYAHPFWHAGKRRNCDGDEDGVMLLMDCLLNFSKFYLPSSLGGKMDAPLVVSVVLDPREVDGESHNCDYMARYPLKFYQEALTYKKPAKMRDYMVLYDDKLDTPQQFEGAMFTHPTQSINFGPRKSAYSRFETMSEKIASQINLAKAIRAVDVKDVARQVIASHFAPDILGNLRAFSTQSFRCPKCSTKYRRIPLSGKCVECGNDLLMTVHAGGITKYLAQAKQFIHEFELGAYTEQRWTLIERYVKSLTDNPRVKQTSLKSFFK